MFWYLQLWSQSSTDGGATVLPHPVHHRTGGPAPRPGLLAFGPTFLIIGPTPVRLSQISYPLRKVPLLPGVKGEIREMEQPDSIHHVPEGLVSAGH
jgi:hypothetical protein